MADYVLITGVAVFILGFGIAAWLIARWFIKRKQRRDLQLSNTDSDPKVIPDHILKDFEEAEARVHNGEDPQKVLWEIANRIVPNSKINLMQQEVQSNGLHTEEDKRSTTSAITAVEPAITNRNEPIAEQPVKRKRGRPKGFVPKNKGVRRTNNNKRSANSNLQRDRESKGRQDLQIQSNNDSAEEQRTPKTDWVDFS